MSELHYMSATEALRLFRARELSPVELVTAVIARAEAVEPAINAFAETSRFPLSRLSTTPTSRSRSTDARPRTGWTP